MSKKSIKKNYLYNLIYQLVALLIPLVTTPYLSRILGAENIGIYSYTISVVTYFILFGTLGVGLYGQREIAYAQDDVKKRSKIFWEINIIRFVTVIFSLLIFFVTYVLFSEYSSYFIILSLNLFATVLDISWLFSGVEDFKTSAIRSIIVRLLATAAIFIFIKDSNSLPIYLIIYSVSTLLSNIALWPSARKYLTKVNIKSLEFKKHIKPVVSLFLPQIASQIYVVLDKVMLGSIVYDKTESGYYEQGEKIIKMVITVITALSTVMIPRISAAFIKKDKKELNYYMSKSFKFVFLLALPMIAGIIITASRFVPIFFGEGYSNVVNVMWYLSPIILIIGFGSIIGVQYLIPTNRQKQLTISYITGAIINVILNAICIPKFGAAGACIGTLFAETAVTSVQLYIIRKEFKLSKIITLSLNYVFATVIMTMVGLLLNTILDNNIISLVIIIISCILSYLIILLAIKDQLVVDFLANIKQKLGR